MLVKCRTCGGENRVHPEQKMLFCSFCGCALAIESVRGPEHLILPHKRNDRNADEVLRSYLLSKNRGRAGDIKIQFSYVPFAMLEEEDGRTRTIPANESVQVILPFPPAGNYSFFDEELAGKEKIIPIERIEKDTVKILHLPLYRIRYRLGGSEWEASVVGESWQVLADELPAKRPTPLNLPNVLAATGLFAIYLFIGESVSGWGAKLAVLAAASTAGLTIFSLRERMAKKR
jgi:hypothetical protein